MTDLHLNAKGVLIALRTPSVQPVVREWTSCSRQQLSKGIGLSTRLGIGALGTAAPNLSADRYTKDTPSALCTLVK